MKNFQDLSAKRNKLLVELRCRLPKFVPEKKLRPMGVTFDRKWYNLLYV
jgi:hypothetical protein